MAASDFFERVINSKALLGVAVGLGAAAGLHHANKVAPTGASGFVQEAITGDPAGISTAIRAYSYNNLYNHIATPYQRGLLSYASSSYMGRVGGRPGLIGPATSPSGFYNGPNGSMVFGLYNLRIR